MMKKRLAIAGCGKLAGIIASAYNKGLLPDYTFVGTWSRSFDSAKNIAEIINGGLSGECKALASFEELMALKPDVLVETASPSAFKALAFQALEGGASIVSLSIGAFADSEFYAKVIETAKTHKQRVYIASGAIGGLDLLRTVSLMDESTLSFDTVKGPNSLKGTPVYEDALQNEERMVFSGSATEAIALFPTRVNVAVAASIASVGPDKAKVSMTSVPGYVGDDHRITIKNKQVNAVVDVYSQTAEITAWSVVNTLRNITSPIVF